MTLARTLVLAGTAAAVLAGIAVFVAWRDGGTAPVRAQEYLYYDTFGNARYIEPDWAAGSQDALPYDVTLATAGATLEEGETAPCAPIGATVWFKWYADREGTLEISTAGSSFNTVLAVYTVDFSGDFLPSPPGARLRPIACDDDGAGQQSAVRFPLVQGQEYIIQVGGYAGATGDLRFRADCNPACPPPNDRFDYKHGIYVNAYQPVMRLAANTRAATLDPNEPRPCGNIGATVWYELYAYTNATIEIDTIGSDYDTVIAVYPQDYSGVPPAGLVANLCDDNGAGAGQARVRIERPTDRDYQAYWVQVGGANGAGGSLVINARCVPGCPPDNDNLQQHQYTDPGYGQEFQTAFATLEAGEPRPCGNIGATVWLLLQIYGDTTITIDTAGSDFDAVVAVYESTAPSPPPANFENIACAASSGGTAASVTFDAEGLHNYYVQLGGRGGATGTLRVETQCTPGPCPPYQDSPQRATELYLPYGLPYEESINTRGGTVQDGEALDCGDMGRTVWYRIYADPVGGDIVVDTTGSSFDTAIAWYRTASYNPSFDELERAGCEPGSAGQRARASIAVEPAAGFYYVQVGGRGGAGGDLRVSVNCVPACPPYNDNAANTQYLGPGSVYSLDTTGATVEEGETLPCGNIGRTVWFNVAGGVELDVRIDTAGSAFAPVIAVYRFQGVSPPGGVTEVECSTTGSLDLQTEDGYGYLVQVGGVDGAGGLLQVAMSCLTECPAFGGGGVIPVDTGGGASGAVRPPDTGSGGYLRAR